MSQLVCSYAKDSHYKIFFSSSSMFEMGLRARGDMPVFPKKAGLSDLWLKSFLLKFAWDWYGLIFYFFILGPLIDEGFLLAIGVLFYEVVFNIFLKENFLVETASTSSRSFSCSSSISYFRIFFSA